jgi:anthranilate phosphoribosyltransferase
MKDILERLTNGNNLSVHEADALLVSLTEADQSPAMAGAILTALKIKGETPEEVRGFAQAMRRLAHRPHLPPDLRAVDIVGTGGDGSGSLNLSTGAALLTAAAGVPVVKHGNRSITSKCGSADVLSALGAEPATPDRVSEMFGRSNFAFLFAPFFHPAMKHLAPIRQALGIRTVFNILGPLTNPAEPPFYLIGAFSADVARIMADALSGLPIQRAFVVHGAEGWDEPTPVGPFHLWDVTPGTVRRETRDPRDIGLNECASSDLAGGEAHQNASAIRSVFDGEKSPHRDALVLAAGLALEVTGVVATAGDGVRTASAVIDDGRAARWLAGLTSQKGVPAAAGRASSV